MSSKTKIVVLHMKEIIYTALFGLLALALLFLLLFMFSPKSEKSEGASAKYRPGAYTSDLRVGSTDLSVEVTVTDSEITSVRFTELNETVTAMYPLIQPSMESIADQVINAQSADDITCSEENPYTDQLIADAVRTALKKAAAD